MEASAVRRPAGAGAPRSTRLLRLASDEKLVGYIRDGSQAAFEVIYDRHHRGILSFCRHMLGGQHEAEDALQHTFMAAYRDLVGSDKDIQLRAWLYTIARNRCLSVLRARRERPVEDLGEIPTEGLAEQVQRRQDLKDMLEDLAVLPEDQRAALVLSELGAMSHDEIAAVIDCPKDKVKALVFQARSSLHSSRDARDADCSEIREMVANLRGGSLRRTQLRRHLRECDGCRAFAEDVKRQRKAIAVLLPVVPSLGLKEQALAAAFGSGGAAAAGTAVVAGSGAGAAAGAGSGLLAKGLVIAAVATTGTAGGVATVNAVRDGDGPARTKSAPASKPPAAPAGVAPAAAPTTEAERTEEQKEASKEKARKRGKEDRGKDLAETRGKGKKRGLRGTQPGQSAAKQADRQQKRAARAERKAAKQVAKPKPKKKAKPQPKPKAKPKPRPTPKPKPTPEPKRSSKDSDG